MDHVYLDDDSMVLESSDLICSSDHVGIARILYEHAEVPLHEMTAATVYAYGEYCWRSFLGMAHQLEEGDALLHWVAQVLLADERSCDCLRDTVRGYLYLYLPSEEHVVAEDHMDMIGEEMPNE